MLADPDDDGVNEYTFQRAQFAAFIDVLEQQVRTIPGLEDYDVAAQFADHEMQFIEEWLNPPTLGDVNADGAVDIVDAMMISNYYNGGSPSPFHWRVADVTADSQIDDADVDCITNYYVGNVTQLFCL